jgi:hypothetical protein
MAQKWLEMPLLWQNKNNQQLFLLMKLTLLGQKDLIMINQETDKFKEL